MDWQKVDSATQEKFRRLESALLHRLWGRFDENGIIGGGVISVPPVCVLAFLAKAKRFVRAL